MISKIMIKSFLVNIGLTTLKLLGAFFSHSLTLMGDAIHCFSDMATDIVSLLGSKLSNKNPDKKHPYGYGKIEYLTSIIISLFIISLGIIIIYNSINGKLETPTYIGIIIIIISIIIKLFLSKYLLKKGNELNSNILIANGTESKYDSFCSMFALIFILISLLGTKNKLFIYSDLIGSIIISILTIKVGISLLIENISSILGEVETNEEKINLVKEIITKQKSVKKVNKIVLLKYGAYYTASIIIEMNGKIELNESYIVTHKIKENLKNISLNIKHIDINIIPEMLEE